MIALNHIFLSLDKPLMDEIATEGGLKLYLSPEYNFEWNATVTGKVAALPIHPKGEYKNVPQQLQVGDEVFFSYYVIADRGFQDSGDYFMPLTEPNPYGMRWTNSKGDKLLIQALPGKISKIWIGLYTDKAGNHIDGTQGNQSTVDRWLAQFKFGGAQDYKFNNLVDVNGADYWKANYSDVFAKKVGDEIIMLGDRVLMTPIEIDVKDRIEIQNGIHIPAMSVKARLYDRAVVVSGGEDYGLKKGDVVGFEEQYVEKYEMWGKKYFMIKQQRINSTWQSQ